MTINEILSEVTILKDCSTMLLSSYIVTIILGISAATAFIWTFIDDFGLAPIKIQVAKIAGAVIGVIGAAGCIALCVLYPVKIDYYVSINDVEIVQLTEYFNVTKLSQVDDMTACHITPKAEYYNEVLALRDSRKGD